MKLKTKKLLRRVLTPFVFVWVCIAVIFAFIGAAFTSVGLYMINDPEGAKEAFKQVF